MSQLFAERTVDLEYEGETFTYWVSLSRKQFEELASGGDAALLGGMLLKWSIGGQTWKDYTFPERPDIESIKQLPADLMVALAALAGEAVSHSLGELRDRRSRHTTRR